MSSTQEKTYVESLVNDLTKLELAERLAFYKGLDRIGNVYYLEPPKGHHTLNEFLQFATGYDRGQLRELLDMGFTKTDRSQRRSIKKYNRHANLLALASLLSQKYISEHDGEFCPRVKGSKKTSDLLDCKSGLKNYYPAKYLETVQQFLNHHPIEDWSADYKGKVMEDFKEVCVDGETKYECTRCGSKKMKKNSRSAHRKKHCHPQK